MTHPIRLPGSLAAAMMLSVVSSTHVGAAPRPACTTASQAAPRDLAGVLDLIARSPRAQAAAAERRALTNLEEQAGRLPNPEVSFELEDFTGSGPYSSFGESQTTVAFSQRLELGGLRAVRSEAARRETESEGHRSELDAVRAAAAAKSEFVSLLAARARVAVADEGKRLAAEVLTAAESRQRAGAGAPADVERARIAVATAGLDRDAAIRDGHVASERLAALWGGEADDTTCIEGSLPPPRTSSSASMPRPDAASHADTASRPDAASPPITAPRPDAARPPVVAAAEAEVETRRAEVALARAEASPDVEFGAGIRHLAGPDEVSFVAGARIEVPFFDRNTGNIAAAEQRLFAAQHKAAAAAGESRARAARLRSTMEAAAHRSRMLEGEMIPAAERAFASLTGAWRTGAASSLEVLEARRALVDLRLDRVEAVRDFHQAQASLEGTLGTVIPAFSTATSTAAAADRED